MSFTIPSATTTTGWTEETRDQFHPGDIITAIHKNRSDFAPSHWVGTFELACHVLKEGREACQPHINGKGSIRGFDFHLIPRLRLCEPYLREKFPDLAAFSDQCQASHEKDLNLVERVEQLFGKTVHVAPMQETNRGMIRDAQGQFMRELIERTARL